MQIITKADHDIFKMVGYVPDTSILQLERQKLYIQIKKQFYTK